MKTKFEDIDLTNLREVFESLHHFDDMYHNFGESPISDADYDDLKETARTLDPTNTYFLGVGSDIRGDKVALPFALGSLDQVQLGDLNKWINKNTMHHLADYVAMDKLDGVSGALIYDTNGNLQIAYSRGDGINGADITRHIRKIKSIPKNVGKLSKSLAIRVEIILSPEKFKTVQPSIKNRAGQLYANPRNLVAGFINSKTADQLLYDNVDVVAYEIIGSENSKTTDMFVLKSYGFNVVPYQIINNSKLTEQQLERVLEQSRANTEYEIDGLVVEVDQVKIRQYLQSLVSRNTLNPGYAFKYKIAADDNHALTEVVGLEIVPSKDGYLKPVVLLNPVNLVGVTVKRATGFNMKFIIDNNVAPGAVVEIVRSGDVIPFIKRVVTPSQTAKQYYDTVLPLESEWKWSENKVDIILNDVSNNVTVIVKKLVDYFASLGVSFLGTGNIDRLVQAGFNTPESIILASQKEIAIAVGSDINGEKIYNSIVTTLTQISKSDFVGSHPAFGRGIGKRKIAKLFAVDDSIEKLSDQKFIENVHGFDAKTAKKIVSGYQEFVKFYEQVKHKVTFTQQKTAATGALTGLTVILTGFRDKQMEEFIIAQGGKVGSSVSSKTSFVVAADPNSTSGKAAKAQELGITVISIDQFKEQYKYV